MLFILWNHFEDTCVTTEFQVKVIVLKHLISAIKQDHFESNCCASTWFAVLSFGLMVAFCYLPFLILTPLISEMQVEILEMKEIKI